MIQFLIITLRFLLMQGWTKRVIGGTGKPTDDFAISQGISHPLKNPKFALVMTFINEVTQALSYSLLISTPINNL